MVRVEAGNPVEGQGTQAVARTDVGDTPPNTREQGTSERRAREGPVAGSGEQRVCGLKIDAKRKDFKVQLLTC